MEKKVLNFLIILVFLLVLILEVSALGGGPASVDINFQPNLEREISYFVRAAEGQELELIVSGELAEYVKLNKYKLKGPGTFTAYIKLPEEIDKPGRLKTSIAVKEKIDEELAGVIGTSVTIRLNIYVHVPYPGRYIDVALRSSNVNVGENITFYLDIESKGTEILSIFPKIDINSEEQFIESLLFDERTLRSQEKLGLKKELDTTGYNAGKYNATAFVDYGEGIAKANSNFRIGELIIYLLDYSKKIFIGDVRAFDLHIESGWNDPIDGAYAEVFFFNESAEFESFKTTSTDLTPWEKKTLTGYFDAGNFSAGIYNANVTLKYYGRERGMSTSEIIEVEFVNESNLMIILIIAGVIILIVTLVLVKKKYFKGDKKRGKK